MRGPVRLQKYLSRAGCASRRQAEDLIRQGRVQVNDLVVGEAGRTIDPAVDEVRLDGRLVVAAEPIWLALNKPRGYVCSRRDPGGRRTVYDLIPREHRGLFHVGRLDLDSEGLLLMTNEGDVANRLLHPRYEVDRIYLVDVAGIVADSTLRQLLDGVQLEDGLASAKAITLRGPVDCGQRFSVTMHEGRKRIVRRMFASVGHPVMRLVRIQLGPVRLGHLGSGDWRILSAGESSSLRQL